MKKVILHHRYPLSRKLLITVALAAYLFLSINRVTIAKDNEVIQEHLGYISGKQLETLYSYKDVQSKDTCLDISVDDAQLLMKIAVAEDYTDVESQAWVMKVILNRVDSPLFPNTVAEVLAQKNPIQFATYYNGTFSKTEPDVNSHLALAMVEGNQINTDALYFEAATQKDSWMSRNLKYLGTVGGTNFYK